MREESNPYRRCLFHFGDRRGRELVDNQPKTDQARSEEKSKDEVMAGLGSMVGSGKQILLPVPNQ